MREVGKFRTLENEKITSSCVLRVSSCIFALYEEHAGRNQDCGC